MTANNALYLRRRSKIVLPAPAGAGTLPLNYLASVLKNIEALGFTLSEPLIAACQRLSLEQLTVLYQELDVDLRKAKGAHREYTPMYRNFPEQVMEMRDSELYLNAILHYVTSGRYLPPTEIKERLSLLDNVELQVIEMGEQEEFEALFRHIAASNSSLSQQDNEDLRWFVETYRSDIARLLPEFVPQKENRAYLASLLILHTDLADRFIEGYCDTATDVLRLAVALSGGDISLAAPTKFRSFKRAERSLLLGLLDRRPNRLEDMLRWKERWIRLGERLHPGEYAKRYPQVAEAFHVLRNDISFPTFNSEIENALVRKDAAGTILLLASRPGDFARRLDHLLRLDVATQSSTIDAFGVAASMVSTPVLLQVMRHFKERNSAKPLRVFFPKGNVAKAFVTRNEQPNIADDVCSRVALICEETLIERFSELPPLGRVYVDEALSNYPVPFSARSASKSSRTLVRGSRLPLPEDARVLRFFVWWKNGKERTDIDLSAALFDQEFNYKDVLSYYNLKSYGGCHSGDIVDAPAGASEFIDITMERIRQKDIRYVVMILTSYTQQPYCDLPECFAGWMARGKANSGEIYEPKTVKDRLDLTADTRIAIPLIIDVAAKEVIWCDMALRRHPRWQNNVDENLKGVNLTLQAFTDLNKPDMYELFRLHALARGELTSSVEAADTIFSVENGTPFRLEEIASQYMA